MQYRHVVLEQTGGPEVLHVVEDAIPELGAGQDLIALLGLLSAGKLDPFIAERLPLDEVVRAHREVERAEVEGKVVLWCSYRIPDHSSRSFGSPWCVTFSNCQTLTDVCIEN